MSEKMTGLANILEEVVDLVHAHRRNILFFF